MSVVTVSNTNFENEVLESKGLVVVDFYADWCGPCQIMSPIIEEIAKTLDQVKFVKVNVDSNPDLASKYSILSIPTLLFFKDGLMIDQITGVIPAETLKEIIDKHQKA